LRTVLVVDDELGILLVLEAVLDEAGYRVVTAGNGRQGLELARAERPDLVLLDWMMPVMDGPATAAAMRADPALARVPVVAMSGAPEASLRRHLDGFAGFLRKPFGDAELLAAVGRVLGDGAGVEGR
jgi:CheY-like chemotaxis protein